MNRTEDELSKNLKNTNELEGGLFAEISLRYLAGQYTANRRLYTVKEGVVYEVLNCGDLYKTGDSLWNLKRDCHRIGKYNSNKNYRNSNRSTGFYYSEIKKILKL